MSGSKRVYEYIRKKLPVSAITILKMLDISNQTLDAKNAAKTER
jgi:hypothetical protein